jgi:hypothetical protein
LLVYLLPLQKALDARQDSQLLVQIGDTGAHFGQHALQLGRCDRKLRNRYLCQVLADDLLAFVRFCGVEQPLEKLVGLGLAIVDKTEDLGLPDDDEPIDELGVNAGVSTAAVTALSPRAVSVPSSVNVLCSFSGNKCRRTTAICPACSNSSTAYAGSPGLAYWLMLSVLTP